jgi:hypothetical protein
MMSRPCCCFASNEKIKQFGFDEITIALDVLPNLVAPIAVPLRSQLPRRLCPSRFILKDH